MNFTNYSTVGPSAINHHLRPGRSPVTRATNAIGKSVRKADGSPGLAFKKLAVPGENASEAERSFLSDNSFLNGQDHFNRISELQKNAVAAADSQSQSSLKFLKALNSVSNFSHEKTFPSAEVTKKAPSAVTLNNSGDVTAGGLSAEDKKALHNVLTALPSEAAFMSKRIAAATSDFIEDIKNDPEASANLKTLVDKLPTALDNASCTVAKENVENFLLIRKKLKESSLNVIDNKQLAKLSRDFLKTLGSRPLDTKSVASGKMQKQTKAFDRICNNLVNLNKKVISFEPEIATLISSAMQENIQSDEQRNILWQKHEAFFRPAIAEHEDMKTSLNRGAISSFENVGSLLRHEAIKLDLLKDYANSNLTDDTDRTSPAGPASVPTLPAGAPPVYYIDNRSDNRIYAPYNFSAGGGAETFPLNDAPDEDVPDSGTFLSDPAKSHLSPTVNEGATQTSLASDSSTAAIQTDRNLTEIAQELSPEPAPLSFADPVHALADAPNLSTLSAPANRFIGGVGSAQRIDPLNRPQLQRISTLNPQGGLYGVPAGGKDTATATNSVGVQVGLNDLNKAASSITSTVGSQIKPDGVNKGAVTDSAGDQTGLTGMNKAAAAAMDIVGSSTAPDGANKATATHSINSQTAFNEVSNAAATTGSAGSQTGFNGVGNAATATDSVNSQTGLTSVNKAAMAAPTTGSTGSQTGPVGINKGMEAAGNSVGGQSEPDGVHKAAVTPLTGKANNDDIKKSFFGSAGSAQRIDPLNRLQPERSSALNPQGGLYGVPAGGKGAGAVTGTVGSQTGLTGVNRTAAPTTGSTGSQTEFNGVNNAATAKNSVGSQTKPDGVNKAATGSMGSQTGFIDIELTRRGTGSAGSQSGPVGINKGMEAAGNSVGGQSEPDGVHKAAVTPLTGKANNDDIKKSFFGSAGSAQRIDPLNRLQPERSSALNPQGGLYGVPAGGKGAGAVTGTVGSRTGLTDIESTRRGTGSAGSQIGPTGVNRTAAPTTNSLSSQAGFTDIELTRRGTGSVGSQTGPVGINKGMEATGNSVGGQSEPDGVHKAAVTPLTGKANNDDIKKSFFGSAGSAQRIDPLNRLQPERSSAVNPQGGLYGVPAGGKGAGAVTGTVGSRTGLTDIELTRRGTGSVGSQSGPVGINKGMEAAGNSVGGQSEADGAHKAAVTPLTGKANNDGARKGFFGSAGSAQRIDPLNRLQPERSSALNPQGGLYGVPAGGKGAGAVTGTVGSQTGLTGVNRAAAPTTGSAGSQTKPGGVSKAAATGSAASQTEFKGASKAAATGSTGSQTEFNGVSNAATATNSPGSQTGPNGVNKTATAAPTTGSTGSQTEFNGVSNAAMATSSQGSQTGPKGVNTTTAAGNEATKRGGTGSPGSQSEPVGMNKKGMEAASNSVGGQSEPAGVNKAAAAATPSTGAADIGATKKGALSGAGSAQRTDPLNRLQPERPSALNPQGGLYGTPAGDKGSTATTGSLGSQTRPTGANKAAAAAPTVGGAVNVDVIKKGFIGGAGSAQRTDLLNRLQSKRPSAVNPQGGLYGVPVGNKPAKAAGSAGGQTGLTNMNKAITGVPTAGGTVDAGVASKGFIGGAGSAQRTDPLNRLQSKRPSAVNPQGGLYGVPVGNKPATAAGSVGGPIRPTGVNKALTAAPTADAVVSAKKGFIGGAGSAQRIDPLNRLQSKRSSAVNPQGGQFQGLGSPGGWERKNEISAKEIKHESAAESVLPERKLAVRNGSESPGTKIEKGKRYFGKKG